MKEYQIIRKSDNGDAEVWATSTRKRDIESRFNRIVRRTRKEENAHIEEEGMGYLKVRHCWYAGLFDGSYFVEWYIIRTA